MHDPNATPDHAGHDHQAGHCSEALAALYTFLDGELTDERRTVIRSHLDECTPCFEAFDFEAELRIVIQQRCREEVPEALRDRILSAIADPPAGELRFEAGSDLSGPVADS